MYFVSRRTYLFYNLYISYLPLAFSIRNNVLKWDLVDLKWWIEFFEWIAKNVLGFVCELYGVICAAKINNSNTARIARTKCVFTGIFSMKFTDYTWAIHHQCVGLFWAKFTGLTKIFNLLKFYAKTIKI